MGPTPMCLEVVHYLCTNYIFSISILSSLAFVEVVISFPRMLLSSVVLQLGPTMCVCGSSQYVLELYTNCILNIFQNEKRGIIRFCRKKDVRRISFNLTIIIS
jgi:hypothetical protein